MDSPFYRARLIINFAEKNVGFKPYKAPTVSMFPSLHAPSLSFIEPYSIDDRIFQSYIHTRF